MFSEDFYKLDSSEANAGGREGRILQEEKIVDVLLIRFKW